MSFDIPNVNVSVSNIDVCKGQTLTVWARPHYKVEPREEGVQVEIRVLDNGTVEIFTNKETKPFSEWISAKDALSIAEDERYCECNNEITDPEMDVCGDCR